MPMGDAFGFKGVAGFVERGDENQSSDNEGLLFGFEFGDLLMENRRLWSD